MAPALGVAARKADGGAFPTHDGEVARLGGGVGFKALDAGTHFDGRAGVCWGVVGEKGDGLKVVGPDGESASARGFPIIA